MMFSLNYSLNNEPIIAGIQTYVDGRDFCIPYYAVNK